MDLGKVTLTHPIDVMGEPRTELRIRHNFRCGDIAALQRYVRKHGITEPIDRLLSEGDFGILFALLDSMCQLPDGTCEQLHPEDLAEAVRVVGPFVK